MYRSRRPERKNTPGRNSALATQHPILVYTNTNTLNKKQPKYKYRIKYLLVSFSRRISFAARNSSATRG
ncbi:hypothetical protein OUZ56_026670 [Daphnia magna]|uniref:Uncharacterized protein n=1 Tax=Daphnia magna TaxID=35525 RepID=A0ABQ9ZMF5_9CRUS|nr:hypothetical protein OUZ56_026670 [Daphnia magna]